MVQILSALDENHITHYSTGQEDVCHSELDTLAELFLAAARLVFLFVWRQVERPKALNLPPHKKNLRSAEGTEQCRGA